MKGPVALLLGNCRTIVPSRKGVTAIILQCQATIGRSAKMADRGKPLESVIVAVSVRSSHIWYVRSTPAGRPGFPIAKPPQTPLPAPQEFFRRRAKDRYYSVQSSQQPCAPLRIKTGYEFQSLNISTPENHAFVAEALSSRALVVAGNINKVAWQISQHAGIGKTGVSEGQAKCALSWPLNKLRTASIA
ncbi:hypothetical protein BDW69DRAFT_1130 [Aspergillus filifer]